MMGCGGLWQFLLVYTWNYRSLTNVSDDARLAVVEHNTLVGMGWVQPAVLLPVNNTLSDQ